MADPYDVIEKIAAVELTDKLITEEQAEIIASFFEGDHLLFYALDSSPGRYNQVAGGNEWHWKLRQARNKTIMFFEILNSVFVCHEIDYENGEATVGMVPDDARDMLKREWIKIHYKGQVQNVHNEKVFSYTYRLADPFYEDCVNQVVSGEYKTTAWDPCPVCGADDPDTSCVDPESGDLIDDHEER